MKITFISLFPSYFLPFVEESIVKRAIQKNLITIDNKNLRQYSNDPKHQKIDDKVYGGGTGMLIQVSPVHEAIKQNPGHVILMSPQGKTFTQAKAQELGKYSHLTIIAGRYEGFDERVRHFVDEEISIGDYVLTGGELPAMVLADSVIRLLPGVIKTESHINDSFSDGKLDFPQYTRPREYLGLKVPEVIVNGHHAEIAKWRAEQKILKTQKKRPDLLTNKSRRKYAK